VSDFGDLSPAAVELQEWLVTAYAKKCERDGTRADGCNSADLIRSFRQKFKLNVQLAIASGLGGMLAHGWSAVWARCALTGLCVRACVLSSCPSA
jgi:hypothetical protein